MVSARSYFPLIYATEPALTQASYPHYIRKRKPANRKNSLFTFQWFFVCPASPSSTPKAPQEKPRTWKTDTKVAPNPDSNAPKTPKMAPKSPHWAIFIAQQSVQARIYEPQQMLAPLLDLIVGERIVAPRVLEGGRIGEVVDHRA